MAKKTDYVARKVAHMNRMGIGASIFRGAATPDWRREQIEEEEKRLGAIRR